MQENEVLCIIITLLEKEGLNIEIAKRRFIIYNWRGEDELKKKQY